MAKYLPPQTNTTTVAAKSRTASKTLFPHLHFPILTRLHGTTAFALSGGRPMVGYANDEVNVPFANSATLLRLLLALVPM